MATKDFVMITKIGKNGTW